MKTEKRNLSELNRNPLNVRKHGKKQIDEFVRSIKQFGVIRPIVIDEENFILCGHGLYEALLQIGIETADCLVMNGLSEKQKKKLLLADNKIYSLGFDDYSAIESILTSMEGDFDIPGYDSETLNELYGIKSISEEAEESFKLHDETTVQPSVVPSTPVSHNQDNTAETEYKPPATVAAARQEYEEKAEQRKYVICPNCGERIEI